MQQQVCSLVGIAAKRQGRGKNWQSSQTLWWKGKPYRRDSDAYQDLLDQAFEALSQNEGFQRALMATRDAVLTHSIGRKKKAETVLTRQEFCSRLMRIRKRLASKT